VPRYFAYGSNLDECRLRDRCPGATLVSVGSLQNFRLDFTVYSDGWKAGAADVVRSAGDEVWGLIFELTDADLDELDRFEGYPHQYIRHVFRIGSSCGELDAWVYTAKRKRGFVAPLRRYVEIIRAAAIRHSFPEAYIRMLNHVMVIDD
jgi:gamma-glutamylcyclotransferase (GGCT)/AIG2-like uncharacterized protein YtfP